MHIPLPSPNHPPERLSGHRRRSHGDSSVGANCAIAAFSLVLVALLMIASIVQVEHEHEDVVAHVIKSNANLAMAYEEHTIRTLKGIDAAVLFLAREYARLGPEIDLRTHIANGVLDARRFAAAVIVDEFGDVVAISEGNAPQFVANRDYFKVHVGADTGTLHVGRPVLGHDTKKQAILMSRRMNHPDGSFAGVVAIAVDPDVFTEFYQQLDLGRRGLIAVTGLDGVVRARRSGETLTAGQDVSGNTLFSQQQQHASGSYTTRGRAEGIRRFTSYRTVSGYPLIVSIGAAEDEVLEGFNERREKYIWATGMIAAVIFAMAALLMTALARRSRAAALLMRSDRRMKATFNHAGIGIVHASIDGRVLQVNQQFGDMLDKRDDELVARPFFDLSTSVEGARSDECCAELVRALAHESSIQIEQSYLGRNGETIWALVTLAMARDEVGDPDYLVATIQNITPQKHLEKELTLRNRELTETTVELHNMLESSTLYSIVSMDLDRTIRSWNAGACRNYGYAPEEMVHRANIAVLHTPEDNANGRVEELFDTAHGKGTAEGVFERIRRNGERFTASVSVTLRRDSAARPIGYLLISKDVTEQKLLEQELTLKNQELAAQNRRVEEANRLKSEFLANMSHELRTPLNAIIGFSEIMHDGKVGPISSEHKEFLGDILTSAKHLLQLINDVLDLSKIEAGKMRFDPEPVQLAKIVNEVRDVLRTMASRKAIDVAIEVDPSLDDIVADAAKLKQVLYNYLSNALKFTPDAGHVTVRAMSEGARHYRLEVEDTGIGIEPEDLDRLFTEFRQLDTGAAKQYQGTGLGLALTRRIVEAQGGRVDVTSMPGHGSTFSAVLPRIMRASEDARTASPVHTVLPQSARSVLLIEDDPSYSGWVTPFLEEHGYRVKLAQDGFAGIDNCDAERFDTILLDILLPGLDGWETLRAIRRHGLNRDTPVVVVSITRPADAVPDYPIQDFLTKPVNAQSLLRSLEEVCRGNARADEILVLDTHGEATAGIESALRANGYRPVRTPTQYPKSGTRESTECADANAV